jgi:hypothetical protein
MRYRVVAHKHGKGGRMSHVYKPNSDVRYFAQGPRGRKVVEETNVYTIIRQMPVEADGRVRYRIKNQADKTERVVTEEELVELN